jgi:hypothetical protein
MAYFFLQFYSTIRFFSSNLTCMTVFKYWFQIKLSNYKKNLNQDKAHELHFKKVMIDQFEHANRMKTLSAITQSSFHCIDNK